MKVLASALAALAFLATPALAQDKDAEKKKLLEEVEKRLREDDEKLLKEIEKLLDEAAPAPAPKPAPPPAAPRKARGFLGIGGEPLTEEDKKDLGVKAGVRVGRTAANGPADKAGLKIGDVITAIDGRPLESPADLPAIVQAAGAGGKVKVEYLRDGKKQTADVVLDRHPEDSVEAPGPAAPPKQDPKEGELRERIKKFMQKQEESKPQAPKGEAPKGEPKPAPQDDLFSLDEPMLEQLRAMMEQFGVEPGQLDGLLEQFLQKGEDGKYRLNDSLKDLFKGFDPDSLDLKKFFGNDPGAEAPKPAPPKAKKESPAPKAGGAYLGLYPEDIQDETRTILGLEAGVGLLVAEVRTGSPAEKAGLRKNDILVKIDGQTVRGEEALSKFMQAAKPGQETTLTILRKAKEETLKVTLGERSRE